MNALKPHANSRVTVGGIAGWVVKASQEAALSQANDEAIAVVTKGAFICHAPQGLLPGSRKRCLV